MSAEKLFIRLTRKRRRVEWSKNQEEGAGKDRTATGLSPVFQLARERGTERLREGEGLDDTAREKHSRI